MSSRRLVTHVGPVKVYKDSEWSEYVCRLPGRPEADYHTDSLQDAIGTAALMAQGK